MALPTVDVLCQQARLAIAERNWEKARQAYQRALALKADAPDIHQGLATVCFHLKDLPGAAKHFKEATRLDPRRAGAYINLGAIYNLLDQLDDAVATLRKGIQIDPQRAEAYYNLGLVYKRKGQIDLAVHAYREALRVNPRLADASYNLGNVFLEKEQYFQAIDCYKQALQVRPDWDKARSGLESAEEALAALEEGANIDDEDGEEADSSRPSTPQLPTHRIDPNRMVDPEAQGIILNALHKATIETEDRERMFLELVERALEPAIKELSSALVSRDVSMTVLDQCLRNFETAIRAVRTVREDLHGNITQLHALGEQLVAQTSN